MKRSMLKQKLEAKRQQRSIGAERARVAKQFSRKKQILMSKGREIELSYKMLKGAPCIGRTDSKPTESL